MKNIILFVGYIPNAEHAIETIRREFGATTQIALITNPEAAGDGIKRKIERSENNAGIVIHSSFSSEDEVREQLSEIAEFIQAVVVRGEAFLGDYEMVIDILPADVVKPSSESVRICSDKSLMREAFSRFDKSITPKFKVITNLSDIENFNDWDIEFPVIIKPLGLSTSMLVARCNSMQELHESADYVFSVLQQRYEQYRGRGEHNVIVEEFISGELYSIDAYVDGNGECTFCPAVRTITAAEAGKTDYYGFIQYLPAELDSSLSIELEEVAQKGITATGLTNSSAHIELIKGPRGLIIVEIGPRLGGMRTVMYELSYGINHLVNDVLIRSGKKPTLGEFKKYSAYVKLYAEQEGTILSITGLDEIRRLGTYYSDSTVTGVGDEFRTSRNGGLGVIDLILCGDSVEELRQDAVAADEILNVTVQI